MDSSDDESFNQTTEKEQTIVESKNIQDDKINDNNDDDKEQDEDKEDVQEDQDDEDNLDDDDNDDDEDEDDDDQDDEDDDDQYDEDDQEEEQDDDDDIESFEESKGNDFKSSKYLDTDSDEYSEEDSDYDEEAFQKLEKEMLSEQLINSHPELNQPSYNEVLALCKIIRNDKGIIVDPLHKTVPYVTKFEYARVIGARTKQLNNGADPFIDVEPDVIDGYTIALKEFEEKKIPFIICRPMPNGGKEYWKLSDLEIVHF